ncbi:MAG TPA: hypothetical protein VNN62_17535 [Methylomirabilota bacterium]|nr:hypothetical protein [Methylomirabilota bacterium]
MNRKPHKKKAGLSRAPKPAAAPIRPVAATAKPVAAADKLAAAATESKSPVKKSLGGTPRFVRCQLIGPDGKIRPGWEMWLGQHCFGRADRKEILLKSLERQQQPPQSFHWREVHRQRFERTRAPKGAEEAEAEHEPEDDE